MSIIRNHYGKKCLSILLQLEPCSVMYKVISDNMAQHDLWNKIGIAMQWKENDLCNISNHYEIKFLSNPLQLEACNDMF